MCVQLIKSIPVLLAACLGSTAFAAPLADHPRHYPFTPASSAEAKTLNFPWIVDGPEGVADRINTYLHDELLFTLPQPKEAAVVEDRYGTLVSMTSGGIAPLNGGRTVRVTVNLETFGAYYSTANNTFDFDFATGRPVGVADVVLPNTYAKLAPKASGKRKAELRAYLAQLKKDARKEHGAASSRTREQIDMYQSCLARLEEEKPASFIGHLELGDGKLSLVSDTCGGHAGAALDELGETRLALEAAAMRPYLNAYGRHLLLGEGEDATPVVQRSGQLFKGTIDGKLKVTLFIGTGTYLDEDDQGLKAHYYYDKYRKQIELRIQRNGERLTLTETGAEGKAGAVIGLKQSGAKLVGEWRGGVKSLPVELTAF
jgi:hypothetical protein